MEEKKWLAEYAGIPGYVKGVSGGSGMDVLSSDMRFSVCVDAARVRDGKIKFNHGALEITEAREDCWEFCVQRVRLDVITEYRLEAAVSYPFALSRPDTTACAVCMEDLSGNVIYCHNRHDICLPCWNLLQGDFKKCPTCRSHYDDTEIERAVNMSGRQVESPSYFFIHADSGGNSHYDFIYCEALFMGAIKHKLRNDRGDMLTAMVMSGFYNFYYPKLGYDKSYGLLTQMRFNDREFHPYNTDDYCNDVIYDYIESINDEIIYKDIAYTKDFYIGESQYAEIDFNAHLTDVVGAGNEWVLNVEYPGDTRKMILKRMIYFRYNIKHMSKDAIRQIIINFFKNLIASHKKTPALYRDRRIQVLN